MPVGFHQECSNVPFTVNFADHEAAALVVEYHDVREQSSHLSCGLFLTLLSIHITLVWITGSTVNEVTLILVNVTLFFLFVSEFSEGERMILMTLSRWDCATQHGKKDNRERIYYEYT